MGYENVLVAGDVDDTPVNGETAVPVSSNWAYDHNARDATAAVQGHATAAQITKLEGIAVEADATPAASTSVAGKIEIAIASEVDTGSDATRAVSPDSLAGSIFGEKLVYLKVIAEGTALTTGDGKMYFTVPDSLNGMNLVDVDAAVYTVATGATLVNVTLYNVTDSQHMLSTAITIDASEYSSYTAATPPVINTSYDDVATGDRIRVDIDAIGNTTPGNGLDVILTFQLP